MVDLEKSLCTKLLITNIYLNQICTSSAGVVWCLWYRQRTTSCPSVIILIHRKGVDKIKHIKLLWSQWNLLITQNKILLPLFRNNGARFDNELLLKGMNGISAQPEFTAINSDCMLNAVSLSDAPSQTPRDDGNTLMLKKSARAELNYTSGVIGLAERNDAYPCEWEAGP